MASQRMSFSVNSSANQVWCEPIDVDTFAPDSSPRFRGFGTFRWRHWLRVGASAAARATRRTSASLSLPRRGMRPSVEVSPLTPETAPMPQIPEGLSEEEGSSEASLMALVMSYYRVVPAVKRRAYVRQVMKCAGECAGRMVREHREAVVEH